MLFHVLDTRILTYVEGVDAVVLAVLIAAVVNAATRNDENVRSLTDIEIVVDHIVHSTLGQNDGDMHAFVLGVRLDDDVNAGLVCLGLDLDVRA